MIPAAQYNTVMLILGLKAKIYGPSLAQDQGLDAQELRPCRVVAKPWP